jgi:hypothetical protein
LVRDRYVGYFSAFDDNPCRGLNTEAHSFSTNAKPGVHDIAVEMKTIHGLTTENKHEPLLGFVRQASIRSDNAEAVRRLKIQRNTAFQNRRNGSATTLRTIKQIAWIQFHIFQESVVAKRHRAKRARTSAAHRES